MSMFNTGDILETIEMFTQDNLDVRTVTMGISLLDCIDPDPKKACENIYNKITTKAANLVSTVERISAEYGIPIINKRISVTPIAEICAAVTADDLADQVYIYEKEGFGSDFYIALNSDGSMRCSEGALSSYFGLGTWKLDGDTVILTTDDEKFVNRFAVKDGTLVYQSADSTGFMYLTVSDGEKFLPSGAPVGSLDIDEG